MKRQAVSVPEDCCDLVMKGGITSGVVYPLAAVELSKSYRFRSIGGTSAGAIAAGAVAAAEYGRRRGSGTGFGGLADLPGWLRTNLSGLFQPTRRMRPIFNTVLFSTREGRVAKLLAPFCGFPLATILGLLPAAGLIGAFFFLEGALPLRIAALVIGAGLLLLGPCLAVIGSALVRLFGLRGCYYGICLGHDRGGDAPSPPLTRWLTTLINTLSGSDSDHPLTFGQLWDLPEADEGRGVDLRMITTNLSQGRPYTLPFENGEEFWFKPDELRDLLPEEVVAHMERHAEVRDGDPEFDGMLRMPPAAQMPVVVGVRMSLSFPVLLSAIPLYAMNEAPEVPSPVPERCWFSDGGITSNFPIHFFDAPVPRWPTFGINLMPLAPGRKISKDERENVWLPDTNQEGLHEAWVGWNERSRLGAITGFGAAIFRTAQNWIDNRQMRGAGFRDRIAHIRMSRTEGGMNLHMPEERVDALAERGRCAAEELRRRFAVSETPWSPPMGWDNQRWLRFRSYMALVERQGLSAVRATRTEPGGDSSVESVKAPPDGDETVYAWKTPEQRTLGTSAANALLAAFAEWEQSAERIFETGAPTPPTQAWSMPKI